MTDIALDLPAHQRAELLHAIEALADRGLFLQAHALAGRLGDYRQWRDPAALALACRLVGHMGAPRLADALAWRTFRRHPESPEARLRYARFLLSRRGQYRAWRFVQGFDGWLPEAPELRAEWLSFLGYLHALLRDFDRSAECHAEAERLLPGDPWLPVERSYSLEQEDRYEEALALCEAVLAERPDYRGAQHQAAQLELQLGREDAALARLRADCARSESASLCAQLTDLLIEREALDEAEHWLAHGEQLAPLMEKGMRGWYAARRCDIACLRGDLAAGHRLALESESPFYRKVAENLAEPQGRRCLLPVRFVRQHHMTCVPATLTALSGYWGRPVGHLEVAEEICYDGTSHQAERAWGERNGWLAREFTVDWATSRALIDRGIPFTLTLQYTGSGHLQAVVGYDEPRGTLLIRDPGQAHFGESLAVGLLESQRPSGPRGMLLLPPEEAHRLDGLELPESDVWDHYYRLVSALEVHDREEAEAALQALRQAAPEHRLAYQGLRALGWYDGRESQVLEATEALLQRFPEDANLILSKATSLSQLESREVHLDWLAQHCQERWCDPVLLVRYTSVLGEDGRDAPEARRLLARVLRQAPTNALAWNELASQLWSAGEREAACDYYRIAACLHDTNEGFSVQYFRALRFLGRQEEGLAFLRRRQARLGSLDAGPSLTLAECLEELDFSRECREVLEQAVEQRPRDPALLLSLADFYGRIGELELNQALLERAEPVSRRGNWLRAAVLHSQRAGGDLEQAQAWCREAAELDPLNMRVHRLQVDLLLQSAGEEAVDAYVEALVARFPHHRGIADLAVERAKRRSLEDTETALLRLLASHPEHAWAIRELAVTLARLGRDDEALETCERAIQVEHGATSAQSTLGFVHLQAGRREAAREAFRLALARSIDNDYALSMLLDSCASREELDEALAYIHTQLVQQVNFGDGWLTYAYQARALLDDAALLEQLQAALERQPDTWQLWVVTARQLAFLERTDEADALLARAQERFSQMPRLGLERALLLRDQGRYAECRETLRDSLRINPLWTQSVRLYVETLVEEGTGLDEAEAMLRGVLQRTPDNTDLRAWLGYVLGERGEMAAGADEAERVLLDEPGNGWAWNQLRRYSAALDQPERPLALARSLVERRAGDSDAWLALAEQESTDEAREQALRRALQLTPRHRGANDQLARLLLEGGRQDELDALLQAPCWGGAPPVELALYGPRVRLRNDDREGAQAELDALLRVHPDAYDGWRELADLHDNGGNAEAYLAAADQMVRLEPRKAVSHGFRGHALLMAERKADALPAFLKAFELDRDYSFAGLHAFDLLAENGRHAESADVVRRLLAGEASPSALVRGVRAAGMVNDRELKRQALERVCTTAAGLDAWDGVVEVLGAPADDRLWREVIEQFASSGELHRIAYRHWFAMEDARWLPGTLWKAFQRVLPQDESHAARHGMLDLLAERKNASGLLTRTLEACAPAIRENPVTWGMASYALSSQERYSAMLHWMGDWRERDDLPAWALDNLSLALRALKRDAEAAQVSCLSLQRDPNNYDAMAWLVGDAALAGDREAVAEWLARLDGVQLRGFYLCMKQLAEGAAKAWEQGDARAAQALFGEARTFARSAGNHPYYRRLRHGLARRLAFGPLTPRWAALWRWLQLA